MPDQLNMVPQGNQQHINLNEIASERFLVEKLFRRETEILMLAETNNKLKAENDALKKEIEALKKKDKK